MPRIKPSQPKISRKTIATSIDEKLADALKELSKDLNKPIYALIEAALHTFILRQKSFLKTRLKKKSFK